MRREPLEELAEVSPKDEAIDLKRRGDASQLLSPGGERRQSLRGFEDTYTDIVDFIVRITHRIWEQADMGYIYDTYQHNCVVHTGYGTSYGVEEVVGGSIALLAGFPDRRLYAEDVIWSGDDEAGFHSSHLIVNTATNLGYSPWGPPTGRPVRYLAIAHCFVKENRVVEEWLVRDTAAMVRQLGFDIREVARRAAVERPPLPDGETDRLRGQLPPAPYQPRHDGDHVEDLAGRVLHEVFNGRHFNLIAETHASDICMWVPNHVQLTGPNHARTYLLGLIAMFPDAHLNIEHVSSIGDERHGYRVAVRWRLSGTHRAFGWYGRPTHKRVNVLGISQLHVSGGKITKHYLVFDELALLMQLAAGTSAESERGAG